MSRKGIRSSLQHGFGECQRDVDRDTKTGERKEGQARQQRSLREQNVSCAYTMDVCVWNKANNLAGS
jgi:hypothetical protein